MESLQKKILFSGTIIAVTGLHIGGTNSSMGIGGPDNMVIRNPFNNKPYIPGSSLKGKMRSLMEIADQSYDKNANMQDVTNGPGKDINAVATKLFGTIGEHQRPSRVIVRDGEIITDIDSFKDTDLPYTESKTEVVIDRVTSKANPRQLERVPAGAKFVLDIVLNIWSNDDEPELINNVFRGLRLVSDDYLGGSGSRGSGKVAFNITSVKERTMDFYLGEADENDLTGKYKEVIETLRAYREYLPETN